MYLETAIFKKIINEHKEAEIKAIKETMRETVRFGAFSDSYIEGCAKDRLEANLKDIQGG